VQPTRRANTPSADADKGQQRRGQQCDVLVAHFGTKLGIGEVAMEHAEVAVHVRDRHAAALRLRRRAHQRPQRGAGGCLQPAPTLDRCAGHVAAAMGESHANDLARQ